MSEKILFKDLSFINEEFIEKNSSWRVIPQSDSTYLLLTGDNLYLSEKEERMDSVYLEMAQSW